MTLVRVNMVRVTPAHLMQVVVLIRVTITLVWLVRMVLVWLVLLTLI